MANPQVDLRTGVYGGVLKQIKLDVRQMDPDNPPLVKVWTCDVEPRRTKDFIRLFSDVITPADPVILVHVKRLQKVVENDVTVIRCIVSSESFLPSRQDVLAFIQEHIDNVSESSLNIGEVQVPIDLPPTKEIALEWSLRYWPISWKGNANHQFLMTVSYDIDAERTVVRQLIEAGQGNSPTTIIARGNGSNIDVLTVAHDLRSAHLLEHSVMNAIRNIADDELSQRQTSTHNDEQYLCHDLLVYTTHEPCAMCAMALVHSRIGRLVYIKPMPQTGAVESKYCLGDRDGLNWKFDIWRWIGPELADVADLPPSFSA